MELDGYIARLHSDVMAAASLGGEAIGEAATRITASLDASLRMVLLEALSDAAAEITAELDGATVEVRLRGRQPDLVVTATAPAADATTSFPLPPAQPSDDDDEAQELGADATTILTARITLRLPEAVKQLAEEAAGRARQSLNTWLVEAVRAATSEPVTGRRRRGAGDHLSGWVR